MEKYMFFYLKTGGGHLAPAKAIEENISQRNDVGAEIILADGFEGSGTIPRKIIEEGYKKAVCNALWVFEMLYAINKIPLIARITLGEISLLIRKGIEKQILNAKPDKIVIFHSFLIKPVYEILDKYKLEIPVLTIVTDPFSAPPIWFLQRRQRFVVFSEQLREKCIEKGIDEDRIKVFPFVLKKQFDLKVEKPDLMKIRSDLGFSPGSRIILIMGGGDGMPGGVKLSKKIAKSMPDAEIAIICGNNKKMHSNLNRIKRKNGLMNLKIYGYVDFVYQLLSVSDVVVTKCGASTIMEILLTGKVPLINQFIWEQEKGNVEFVCKGKMGIHEKSVKRLTEVVGRLISDQDFFNSFTGNIRNASLSNGVEPVSDYILSFSNR